MIIESVLYLLAAILSLGGFIIAGYAYNFHRREFHKIRSYEEMVQMVGTCDKLRHDILTIEKQLKDKTDDLNKAQDLIAVGNSVNAGMKRVFFGRFEMCG